MRHEGCCDALSFSSATGSSRHRLDNSKANPKSACMLGAVLMIKHFEGDGNLRTIAREKQGGHRVLCLRGRPCFSAMDAQVSHQVAAVRRLPAATITRPALEITPENKRVNGKLDLLFSGVFPHAYRHRCSRWRIFTDKQRQARLQLAWSPATFAYY